MLRDHKGDLSLFSAHPVFIRFSFYSVVRLINGLLTNTIY